MFQHTLPLVLALLSTWGCGDGGSKDTATPPHSGDTATDTGTLPRDSQPLLETADTAMPDSGTDTAVPGQVESFKVLSYNMMMLPWLVSDWAHDLRAQLVVDSGYLDGFDVLIFQELFNDDGWTVLLDGLEAEYPYRTPIVGGDDEGWDESTGMPNSGAFTSGGAMIMSRWPIVFKAQYLYGSAACGTDLFANKGLAYAVIDKDGTSYHVIGTHTQSEATGCDDGGVGSRAQQFQMISDFIADQEIPVDEMVIIGGDLNVDRYGAVDPEEYDSMLELMQVEEPRYAGHEGTWDPQTNEIAAYDFSGYPSEYLDYILVERNHRVPAVWHNLAWDIRSDVLWSDSGYYTDEFSDHYPVMGFIYADESTPTSSTRLRHYDRVSFQSASSGKYIMADPDDAEGWLQVEADSIGDHTEFNLVDVNNDLSDPDCIQSGLIRIEPNDWLNHFWNTSWTWWYYPSFNDGSNNLELEILDGGCLESGSQVAFRDFALLDYYYAQKLAWEGTDYLYLGGTEVGDRERFVATLCLDENEDWSGQLVYAP